MVPARVLCTACRVIGAVQLHHQPHRRSDEVRNVAADDELAPEGDTQSAAAKVLPQPRLAARISRARCASTAARRDLLRRVNGLDVRCMAFSFVGACGRASPPGARPRAPAKPTCIAPLRYARHAFFVGTAIRAREDASAGPSRPRAAAKRRARTWAGASHAQPPQAASMTGVGIPTGSRSTSGIRNARAALQRPASSHTMHVTLRFADGFGRHARASLRHSASSLREGISRRRQRMPPECPGKRSALAVALEPMASRTQKSTDKAREAR